MLGRAAICGVGGEIATGIRYSLSPSEAILEAMRRMGTVIMSAAVILGGTFAAMLPSGVMSLLQIASVVQCGLFLYALIILPLFVQVMVRTFGQAIWWPFMSPGERATEEQEGIRGFREIRRFRFGRQAADKGGPQGRFLPAG